MEWKKLLYGCVGLFAACALAGCGKEEAQNLQYLNLSDIACSFTGEDNLPFTVKVYAYADWKAESDASWAKIGDKTEDSFTITVDDNPDKAERSARISLTAGALSREITVFQMASGKGCVRYRKLIMFGTNLASMSKDGRYVAGYATKFNYDTERYEYFPTVIETETGEVHEFGPYVQSELWFNSLVGPVMSDGTVVYHDANVGGSMLYTMQNEVLYPQAPAADMTLTTVSAVSEDDTKWVGYARSSGKDGKRGLYKPVLWVNGVPQELPMPEKDMRGYDFLVGVMARGISNNGEVIYGSTWENNDSGMVYWKDGKVRYAGEDVYERRTVTLMGGDGEPFEWNLFDGLTCTAESWRVSPNGVWLGSRYRQETESGGGIVMKEYAAVYNTETEQTTIFWEYPDSDVMFVTDDGICMIAPIYSYGGTVVDAKAGIELGSVSTWVYQNYGIVIPETSSIVYVSPDGRYVLGMGMQQSAASPNPYPFAWYIAPPLDK